MKIVLADETEIEVLTCSGTPRAGIIVTKESDTQGFAALVETLTPESVALINVYDGENLVGIYGNQLLACVKKEGELITIETVVNSSDEASRLENLEQTAASHAEQIQELVDATIEMSGVVYREEE